MVPVPTYPSPLPCYLHRHRHPFPRTDGDNIGHDIVSLGLESPPVRADASESGLDLVGDTDSSGGTDQPVRGGGGGWGGGTTLRCSDTHREGQGTVCHDFSVGQSAVYCSKL